LSGGGAAGDAPLKLSGGGAAGNAPPRLTEACMSTDIVPRG